MDFKRKNIADVLSTLIDLGFDHTRHERACKFSDRDFITMGCHRVLGSFQSGRDFLQHKLEVDGQSLARSTFFKALSSDRRFQLTKDVSQGIFKVIQREMDSLGVDYFKDFSELDEYDIYAGDGHFIEHACHTAVHDPKKEKRREGKLPKLHAAGLLYVQNLRNGLLSLFAPVTDGGCKNHEMPIFRKNHDEFFERTSRKVIYVLDRAYVDKYWWGERMGKGANFVSRSKSNFSLTICGELDFDEKLPVNTGIKRDFLAGMGNSSAAFRFIDYEDPETGEAYQFYTSLMDIQPGLVAWLYFKRWTIEKTYDTSKNSLNEQKAWATGENALQIQAHIITIVYNLLRLFNEITFESMDSEEKKNYQKKYSDWIIKREKKAQSKGRSIHSLLKKSLRMPKIAIQFIRCLKNNFTCSKPLEALLPILRLRLTCYSRF